MSIKLGLSCSLYVGTAGSTPTSLLYGVSDLTLNIDHTMVDASARGSWHKTYLSGLSDIGLEFKVQADNDNSALTPLRSAGYSGGSVAVKVDLGDGNYFQADMVVEKFTSNQANEEVVSYSVSLKLSAVGTLSTSFSNTSTSNNQSGGDSNNQSGGGE